MDTTKIIAIVSLILALSIASERLVEIIKGLIPVLDKENTDPRKERLRHACLQFLAVLSGIATAYLAKDAIPVEIQNAAKGWGLIGLGLLASGGSGLWNSILAYVTHAKDLKEADALRQKAALH